METKEKTYTVKEIADIEGVSADTVYRWCKDNYLIFSRNPSKKGKGSIFITESNYKEFKKLFINLF